MKRNLILTAIPFFLIFAFDKWKDNNFKADLKMVKSKPLIEKIQDLPISIKNTAIKRSRRSTIIKEPFLSEREIESIHLQDEKVDGYKSLLIPTGKLLKRITLDDDSYAEIFKTNTGDEVINIYNGGLLTEEKWQAGGRSIIRSYENDRIFAISEESKDQTTTLFYDSNSEITKRMDSKADKKNCTIYLNGRPHLQSLVSCKYDDYREYDDIREN